jgi:hypothetical protein
MTAATLLKVFNLDEEIYEVLDGRSIRYLSQDDQPDDDEVVLVDGQLRPYLVQKADWEAVRHLSIYR